MHLLIEPLPQGSGLVFGTVCPEDSLDRSWQRLILTHLAEKTHIGVLTGSPITDMKITLVSGRAHLKHTQGGDFRQATYRAVRMGLECAENILLEPWYAFTLTVPEENTGRALNDLQRLGAKFDTPLHDENGTLISGSAPVAGIRGYHTELAGYTKGRGRLSCTFAGYLPCADAGAVIAKIGYQSENDLENTADSIFCSHGAGHAVKWNEVTQYMHLPSCFERERKEERPEPQKNVSHSSSVYDDKQYSSAPTVR